MSVYLDWNATAPPLPACLDAMAECARAAWGNPASVHAHGRAARARVEAAREAVAELAEADARDVTLTSGGTEANNLAIRSAFAGKPAARRTIVTSRLEHPSVVRVAEAMERERAARVRFVAVRSDGRIDLEDLARVCGETEGDVLVALQAVNHETGAIQPLDEAIRIARARGAREGQGETLVHVDAVQAFGRVALSCAAADTRSLAGHKLRGPKGIGALVTRPGLRLVPVLVGGAQEKGIRPGTVDPVAAAGLAVAARHAVSSPARYAALAPLRDRLEARLLTLLPAGRARVNGGGARAPHVTNVSFDLWNGPELVAALDLEGVSVSSGSACSAGTIEASPVVTAMVGESRARSAVRVSLGEDTTAEDVERAAAAFAKVIVR